MMTKMVEWYNKEMTECRNISRLDRLSHFVDVRQERYEDSVGTPLEEFRYEALQNAIESLRDEIIEVFYYTDINV